MNILFEDDNYIILNKPAGILVHPDGRENGESITAWLAQKYPALESVGGEIEVQQGPAVKRWGVAHRIDRETSGVLAVAKNHEAFEDLQHQFQERMVEKTYHAFVYGRVTVDSATIERRIGRSKTDFRRWATGRDARGKLREATTEYRVMHKTNEATFMEAIPRTGRTHQIRVHFKDLGHPIIGDTLYAGLRKPILGFERLALHAKSISFTSLHGEPIFAEASYPADFQNALKLLGIVAK